jgi:hypothetical protein
MVWLNFPGEAGNIFLNYGHYLLLALLVKEKGGDPVRGNIQYLYTTVLYPERFFPLFFVYIFLLYTVDLRSQGQGVNPCMLFPSSPPNQ